MTSWVILIASSNVTFTNRKCIHVLNIYIKEKKKNFMCDIAWIFVQLKDKYSFFGRSTILILID